MSVDHGLYCLKGQIQNYAWGGQQFIPDLVGLEPELDTHFAEYWLGAHPKAPAIVLLKDGTTIPLNDLVASYPQKVLGPHVAKEYGQLPYLFKVLDVGKPLSIQVHPTKAESKAGYERENKLGISLDAAERNYRDKNHKPELMVALSDFWLLHGFLPQTQLFGVLKAVPELSFLQKILDVGGIADLYRHVMTMQPEEVDAILEPLARRINKRAEIGGLEKSSPEYWVAKVVGDRSARHYDRGIFSLYFFNLVHLGIGQGIFQDAGIPHAYLEGQNIELMANSDNVLRGGLTGKHVDVPELLRVIKFSGITPKIIEGTRGENSHEIVYDSVARDFRLSCIKLGEGERYVNGSRSIEIILGYNGMVMIEGGATRIPLRKGQSVVVFAETTVQVTALSEEAMLFRASIPE